jgi:hypothetical protein
MEKIVKSLAYALERDLRKDGFVFRRTARAIISMLKTSNFNAKDLGTMEKLLLEKNVFTDEGLMEIQLENLFGESSTNRTFLTNLEIGLELLNAIRNKKEALRPPL